MCSEMVNVSLLSTRRPAPPNRVEHEILTSGHVLIHHFKASLRHHNFGDDKIASVVCDSILHLEQCDHSLDLVFLSGSRRNFAYLGYVPRAVNCQHKIEDARWLVTIPHSA